jgi:hypothetical protein
VTRRRRGIEPPPPNGFGTPDVRWDPSTDHDAVHIAALSLQHLVLCEIRRLAGEGATADLSRLLDVSARTVQRITAGDHLLGIDELIELACLFGDELLAVIPRSVTQLFPGPYRPYLESWAPGTRTLPVFGLLPVPETIDWASLAAGIGEWLAGEVQAGRIGLVNAWVAGHFLARLLVREEVPGSLIVPVSSAAASHRWLRLDILTRTPTRALLCYLLDPIDDPVAALRDTLSGFYAVLAQDGHRVALLCLGQRMSGQFRVHIPGLITAARDDTLTVPFQVSGALGVASAREHPAPDLALTVAATSISESGVHVLALGVGKAD